MQTCRNCEINARMCIDAYGQTCPLTYIPIYIPTLLPQHTCLNLPTIPHRTLHCITLPAHALHYITLHYMSVHYVILLYFTFHWGVHTSMHTHTYMNLYIILSQLCIHPSMHTDNQVLPTLPYTCLCTTHVPVYNTRACVQAHLYTLSVTSVPFHSMSLHVLSLRTYIHT